MKSYILNILIVLIFLSIIKCQIHNENGGVLVVNVNYETPREDLKEKRKAVEENFGINSKAKRLITKYNSEIETLKSIMNTNTVQINKLSSIANANKLIVNKLLSRRKLK